MAVRILQLPGPVLERRHHARIEPKGTAVILAGEYVQRGRIANLSEGGMLVTTAVSAPARLLARPVEMELRLDGRLDQWIRVSGKIVRLGAERLAVTFDSLPSILLRLIDEMTAASRNRKRVLSIVLVDEDLDRRALIAEGFRAVGCGIVEASTPLEAIVRLGETSFEPDLIAVADSIPAQASDTLREFVDREHPQVKLVTISNDAIEPAGIANWLSSTDPNDDLITRIRDLLVRPRPSAL
jgi:CheY-like chemotaxis protein